MRKCFETELYAPVKQLFLDKGYKVTGEVNNCDVTALKDDELIVVELKTELSFALLYQAIERQGIANIVYVAVPHPQSKTDTWKHKLAVVKKLNIGLITVDLNKQTASFQFEPFLGAKKRSNKKRSRVLNEISNRTGDYNTGGSTKTKIVTAYNEKSIAIACILFHGELAVKEINKLTDFIPDKKSCAYLLRGNFHGWFENVSRGRYALSDCGRRMLFDPPKEFANVVLRYQEKFMYMNNGLIASNRLGV